VSSFLVPEKMDKPSHKREIKMVMFYSCVEYQFSLSILCEELHAIFAIRTEEGITSRAMVVRSIASDTLTQIHCRVVEGDKRGLNEPIHDHANHGNPLIVVYCGDLSGTTAVVMRGG
jgi:hypothetical protein